jgi:putative DNA primase/helicase
MNINELFPTKLYVSAAVANFGEAEQIARALKGHRSGKGWLAKCPCHDDRTASLSITEGDDARLLLNCFAGCEFTDIIDALRDHGVIGANKLERGRRALAYVNPTLAEPEPDKNALAYWDNGVRLLGTPATNYLVRRGILAKPPSLRYHSASRAMVAAVQRLDGEVIAVQRTFITPDGLKAAVALPRLTTGALGGGAVRFAAAAEVMGLAEGVETAMSAMAMADLPVWASLGSQRLHRVILPAHVREVHIFGDNDDPGRAAARKAADVHHQAGRHVVLRFPPDGVGDFNDVLLAHADRDGSAAA